MPYNELVHLSLSAMSMPIIKFGSYSLRQIFLFKTIKKTGLLWLVAWQIIRRKRWALRILTQKGKNHLTMIFFDDFKICQAANLFLYLCSSFFSFFFFFFDEFSLLHSCGCFSLLIISVKINFLQEVYFLIPNLKEKKVYKKEITFF